MVVIFFCNKHLIFENKRGFIPMFEQIRDTGAEGDG